MRAIYYEAILALANRIDGGEEVVFTATIPGRGWKSRHIRITPEVYVAMSEVCQQQRVHRSVFFLRALRDYLSSKGVDAPE
jgi:hypothetical protein